MSRRRLRIISSSSDEDDEEPLHQQAHQLNQETEPDLQQHPTLNLENVTLNSSSTSNPNFPEPIPLEISDDDFTDVAEHLSPPSPLQPPSTVSPSSVASRSSGMLISGGTVTTPLSVGSRTSSMSMDDEGFGCPITGVLHGLGLRLRKEWLDACIHGLERSVPVFSTFDATRKAKLCFEQFLCSDMNVSGAGVLPGNVHQMHLVDLPGPYVLQVDEIVNISRPLRDRYQSAVAGLKRCLKLSMTDGVQRVFGMEYQPIKDLEVLASAGLKVVICNVNVRHGLLMLVPEVFQVLGGSVEELDAARQRLVNEVNKPPRGKRTRSGVVPPLATRATLAAWPPDNDSFSGSTNNHAPEVATLFQTTDRGAGSGLFVNGRHAEEYAVPDHRGNAVSHSSRTTGETYVPINRGNAASAAPLLRENAASIHLEDARPNSLGTTNGTNAPVREEKAACSLPIHRENAACSLPIHRENAGPLTQVATDETDFPIHRDNAGSHIPSIAISDDEDIYMADALENQHILTNDRESPFTYLSSLSVRWAASKDIASHVQGRIKCFLTGVKGFQYKRRTAFELQVYVDDGSLISEILIDHDVVLKEIGYSPEEVTAALASSDSKRVCDMKETLKKFQALLVNFEGIMLVRISGASPLPVAIEMQQGCPVSDAWSLLRRLKSSSSDQPPQHPQLHPINISP